MEAFYFSLFFWFVLDDLDDFGGGLVFEGTYCYFLHVGVGRALLVGAKMELFSWKFLVGVADRSRHALFPAEVLPSLNRLYFLLILELLHDVEDLRGRNPSPLQLLFLLLLPRLF